MLSSDQLFSCRLYSAFFVLIPATHLVFCSSFNHSHPPFLPSHLLPCLISSVCFLCFFHLMFCPLCSLPITFFPSSLPFLSLSFCAFHALSFLSLPPSIAAPECWRKAAEQSREGTEWGLISDVLLLSEMDRKDCSALSTFVNVLGWGNDTGDAWAEDSDDCLGRLGLLKLNWTLFSRGKML